MKKTGVQPEATIQPVYMIQMPVQVYNDLLVENTALRKKVDELNGQNQLLLSQERMKYRKN